MLDNFWVLVTNVSDSFVQSFIFNRAAEFCFSFMRLLGVPTTHIPSPIQLAQAFTIANMTLLSYWFWLGSSHSRRRRELERKLTQAQETVRNLEEKLLGLEIDDLSRKHNGKEIRIWMDGAFDMMHFGHMNAFRQGRSLGTKLIVGVNSDETITVCKGDSDIISFT